MKPMKMKFRRERDDFKVIHVTTSVSRATANPSLWTIFVVFSSMAGNMELRRIHKNVVGELSS
jgi:hypothetical protein